MNTIIRYVEEKDRSQIVAMMKEFYTSDLVYTNGSDEIYNADIDGCLGTSPFIEGYVFENDDCIQGYAMIAKSFSTEFGKPCIWIEDIYVKKEFRGCGIGSRFLHYVEEKYPNAIYRLEVEAENKQAINVYKKCGYNPIPYMEMKK